jgi:hypothetical protein
MLFNATNNGYNNQSPSTIIVNFLYLKYKIKEDTVNGNIANRIGYVVLNALSNK